MWSTFLPLTLMTLPTIQSLFLHDYKLERSSGLEAAYPDSTHSVRPGYAVSEQCGGAGEAVRTRAHDHDIVFWCDLFHGDGVNATVFGEIRLRRKEGNLGMSTASLCGVLKLR